MHFTFSCLHVLSLTSSCDWRFSGLNGTLVALNRNYLNSAPEVVLHSLRSWEGEKNVPVKRRRIVSEFFLQKFCFRD